MMSLRENAFMNAGAILPLLAFGKPLAALATLAIVWYLLHLDRHKFVIRGRDPLDQEPYLTRWHLFRCRWFRVFLHNIHRPDPGTDLHNHPWPRAFAFVLRGGYYEFRTTTECDRALDCPSAYPQHADDCSLCTDRCYGGFRSRLAPGVSNGPINVLGHDTYHRITWVAPNTWTLFVAGRRSRDWGFLVDGQHVPCRTYLGLPPDHDFGD